MLWLNQAGRTTLINSILGALPLYQFALISAPASIHKQIELIIGSFLWQGGKRERKKFNLINWKQVTASYKNGGLSIKLPRLMNTALGRKITWSFLTGEKVMVESCP